MAGISSEMRAAERLIAEITLTEVPVLIVGESGTAKEITALRIHALSKHRSLPFVKVSCGKFSLEGMAALFNCPQNGHRLGADSFGGRLLLDNLGELDSSSQRELLHAIPDENELLEEPRIRPRIISSATPALESDVQRGGFRGELFYRLKEDIPLLVEYFLHRYAENFGRTNICLSDGTMQILTDYSWPGNIRELENTIKKIVALESEELGIADLKMRPAAPAASQSAVGVQSLKQAARAASQQVERELILETLSRTQVEANQVPENGDI